MQTVQPVIVVSEYFCSHFVSLLYIRMQDSEVHSQGRAWRSWVLLQCSGPPESHCRRERSLHRRCCSPAAERPGLWAPPLTPAQPQRVNALSSYGVFPPFNALKALYSKGLLTLSLTHQCTGHWGQVWWSALPKDTMTVCTCRSWDSNH